MFKKVISSILILFMCITGTNLVSAQNHGDPVWFSNWGSTGTPKWVFDEPILADKLVVMFSTTDNGSLFIKNSEGKETRLLMTHIANQEYVFEFKLQEIVEVRYARTYNNKAAILNIALYKSDIPPKEPPQEPYNLYVKEVTDTSITFGWFVDNSYFSVYVNNELYATNILNKEYTLTNLEPGKTYKLNVSRTVDGMESALSQPLFVKTYTKEEWSTHPDNPEYVPDVKNLKGIEHSSSIKLSWINPEFERFSHVNIYRKNLDENKIGAIEEFFLGKAVYANEDYVKMFSTNGTWWEDHTVQKSKSYEYLVKVEDTNQKESKGVTIKVTAQTPPPKPPEDMNIIDGEDGNGKYLLIEWSPVENAVHYEIIIDGGEPIIVYPPQTSYKYYHDGTKDKFDVQIVVVGEDGLKSPPKRPPVFRDVDWNITVGELIKNTLDYIMLFKEFVLLGIVLILAPMLVAFFKRILRNRQFKGVRI